MQSKNGARPARRLKGLDEARFLAGWFRKPMMMGAVFPSSRGLAQAMAGFVPLEAASAPGNVVLELGPGTGVVTRALVDRGIPESNLVLVEYSREFCVLLRSRYKSALVVEGDAYCAGAALARAVGGRRITAVVSSLPLMTRPEDERADAIAGHLELMPPGAPFIQFTYVPSLPVKPARIGARIECSRWVKRNLPPARVIVYRRDHDDPMPTAA